MLVLPRGTASAPRNRRTATASRCGVARCRVGYRKESAQFGAVARDAPEVAVDGVARAHATRSHRRSQAQNPGHDDGVGLSARVTCAVFAHVPRLSTTPERWLARGEARNATVSATCSGSMTRPKAPSRRTSSVRDSSPYLLFANVRRSAVMRLVRVAGGCTPTTRTPNSGDFDPRPLVNAASPALAKPPQMYSQDGFSPAMPMTFTITPRPRARMCASISRVMLM